MGWFLCDSLGVNRTLAASCSASPAGVASNEPSSISTTPTRPAAVTDAPRATVAPPRVQVALMSANCYEAPTRSAFFERCEGTVRNVGGVQLSNVWVVIDLVDANGHQIQTMSRP